MTSRYNIFLFIFLTLAYICGARPAMAEPDFGGACTQEQQAKIKSDLGAKLQEAFNNFKDAVSKYNPLAEDYLKNCEGLSSLPMKPPRLSPQEETTAKTYDVDVSDANLYKYLNAPWGNIRAESDDCKAKKAAANEKLSPCLAAYETLRRSIQTLKNDGMSMCTCDEDGQQIMCTNINNKTKEAENKKGRCGSFNSLLDKLSNCPLCGVFEAILSASAKVAHVAWDYTAKPLIEVVVIFFMVLLALEVLKAVAAVGGIKISAFLKGVMGKGLKIAITVLLLSESQYIYTLFISPVLQGGLDMGLAIATSGGNEQCTSLSMGGVILSHELDSSLFNKILDTVRCFGTVASTIPAVGMGLICHAFPEYSLWNIIRVNILPDFSMLFSGFIMLGFGVMIWMSLAFYLIDCVVQIGMLTALVPLLIACWPFKITEQYTIKGIKMMMNTFFNFAMMGTVLLMGSQIIAFSLSGEGDTSMQDLLYALNNDSDEKLKKLTSLDSMRVILLLACSVFALKLIGKAESLANQFSQGSGSSIGKEMGAHFTAAATEATKGGLTYAGRGIGHVGGQMLEKSGLKGWANKKLDGALELRRKALGTAGKALGLGRFQNNQTGSGLPDSSGSGSGGGGSGGGNPPLPGGGGGNPPLPGGEGGDSPIDTEETTLDNVNTPENENGQNPTSGGEDNGNPNGNERQQGAGANENGAESSNKPNTHESRPQSRQTEGNNPVTPDENVSDNPTEDAPESSPDNPSGSQAENPSEEPADNTYNDSAEKPSEGAAGNPSNGSAQKPSDKSADSASNGSAKDPSNKSAGSTSNEAVRNPAGGAAASQSGESANGSSDNPQGSEQTTVNEDGSTTQKKFGKNGKLTSETTRDKDGNESMKSYNEDGSIKYELNKNADGSSTQILNDEHGNKKEEHSRDKDGNHSWKSYNKDGSISSEGARSADGSGHVTINDDHGNKVQDILLDKNGKNSGKEQKK